MPMHTDVGIGSAIAWRRRLLALCTLFVVGAPLRAQSGSPLVGTWRLRSLESRDERGAISYPMGLQVDGRLTYDAHGNLSVHIMAPDRPAFASGDRARGTESEVRAAFVGYLAYYGRYTLGPEPGTVVHHVQGASFPNWVGGDQRRTWVLEGDRLTIGTPPMLAGGSRLETVLVWERMR